MAESIPPHHHNQETTPEPSEEAIRQLAHSYWKARGRQGGPAEEDWLEAERELKRMQSTSYPGG